MGSCQLASSNQQAAGTSSAQGAFWARRSRMGCLSIIVLVASLLAVQAADLRQKTWAERARRSAADCPAFEPFRCPEESRCISIQYLCDGAPDCSDAYDENPRLCTAARRPPVRKLQVS